MARVERRRLVDEARGVTRDPVGIAAWAAGEPRADFLARLADPAPAGAIRRLRRARLRLRTGEPEAYVRGVQGFWRRELAVGRGVLIPRPDTELLVELAAARVPPGGRFAELGTGSAAVAIAILDERADVRGVATERSADALRWARRNAAAAGHGARLRLLQGDLTAPLRARGLAVDVLVMNPPYIGRRERVARELGWEPEEALYAGLDGFYWIRRLLVEAPGVLRPQGALIFEVGYGQAAAAAELAERRIGRGGRVSVHRDLAGQARALVVEWTAP
jgi:release factor glutamine methyltransferase